MFERCLWGWGEWAGRQDIKEGARHTSMFACYLPVRSSVCGSFVLFVLLMWNSGQSLAHRLRWPIEPRKTGVSALGFQMMLRSFCHHLHPLGAMDEGGGRACCAPGAGGVCALILLSSKMYFSMFETG